MNDTAIIARRLSELWTAPERAASWVLTFNATTYRWVVVLLIATEEVHQISGMTVDGALGLAVQWAKRLTPDEVELRQDPSGVDCAERNEGIDQ